MNSPENHNILIKLQVSYKEALNLLEILKKVVKIKVGAAGKNEIQLEKTELIPNSIILSYFIEIVHSAQKAIDERQLIAINDRDSMFISMRNLIMVLKEIRQEMENYKNGLKDIRNIYQEELKQLENPFSNEPMLQENNINQLSSCKLILHKINTQIKSFEEKLDVLKVVTNY